MSTLGFDKYVEPLKVYLAKYREAVRGDKPEKAAGTAAGAAVRPPATSASAVDCVGASPPGKRVKKEEDY
jgi:nuclear transcription Y subunit beta